MELYFTILISAVGAVFGSFISCAGVRTARGEDFIHGKSRCEHCNSELGALDLIPVLSYLMTGGRCRYCRQKISAAYPLSELLFMALILGLYRHLGLSPEFFRDAVFCGVLFYLSITDALSFNIPDGCLLIAAAAWVIALPFMDYGLKRSLSYLLTAAAVLVIMLAFSLFMDQILGRESLGGGDIKLFSVMALYLGLFGVYALIITSCVSGLIFVGTLKASGRLPADGRVPFGPVIAVSGYAMFFAADPLKNWYIGLLAL